MIQSPLTALAALALAAGLGACTATETPNLTSTAVPSSALSAKLIEAAQDAPAPAAEKRPVTTEQIGRVRTDDYAWLKADNWQDALRDPAVLPGDIRAHLEAENAYVKAVMAPTQALQQTLFEEMKGRIKEDDSSVPVRDGPWAYLTRYREGGQHPILARLPVNEDGEEEGPEQILLDGDKEAEGHDYFDLGDVEHSPNHLLLAVSEDLLGSEYYTVEIRAIATGKTLGAPIENTTGDLAWSAGSDYLFWVFRDDNGRPKKVYRRPVGGTAADDVLVYEEPDDGFFVDIAATRSGRFILVSANDHTTSEVRVIDAHNPTAEPILVAPRERGHEYDLTHAGDMWVVRTNSGEAVDFQLMAAPLDKPQRDHWRPLVPHRPGVLLLGASGFKNHLVRMERENALPRLVIRRLSDAAEHAIAFDEAAYALGMETTLEWDTAQMRFAYESPSTPERIYDYDMDTRERVMRKEQEVPSGHDPADYVVERIVAVAKDGAEVPVTLLRRADAPAGPAPMLLYGYGSYGITIPADFRTSRLSLVDRGATYAIAHVRGGMAKGYGWYLDGKLDKKTNTFDDFIAAGEALVEQGYARRGEIVIQGGSAGGLLVGAALNRDQGMLWGGAIAQVPFVDVLNTMSDAQLPLTPPEWTEWGNPLESAEAYDLILSYSPYDQTTARPYPPILITSGVTDPRVTYWEPAKWAAKLREVGLPREGEAVPGPGGRPAPLVLSKTNMDAGHRGASGRFDSLKETAEAYAFALHAMGLE